jgi:arginase
MKRDFKFIFNKSEIGAGTRGSSLGIDALMMAAISKGSSFFADSPAVTVNSQNHILAEPNSFKWAKHIDALVRIYKDVCTKVSEVILEKKFPIIISGDHASAGGSVAGIKAALPDKRLGIIWIDAHADLHSPYTSPSGNVHGMPLAAILNEDNKKFDPGDVEEQTAKQWEKLKKVGGIGPKAQPKDLVFIGLRDTEKEEDYLIEKFNITHYPPPLLRQKGMAKVISEIKNEKLKDCDKVYISFDVDSLDCVEVSYGTGTPVENGLLVNEAKALLKGFMDWEKVIGLEITEINPLLDNKQNRMAETTLDILEFALVK